MGSRLARLSTFPQGGRSFGGDPLAAGYWPYITPSGPAAIAAEAAHRQSDPGETDPTDYLYERYLDAGWRGPLTAYYALRPLLPRSVQLALRRAYTTRQAAREFPRWPIEPLLVDGQYAHMRRRLRDAGENRLQFVNFWPDGKRFCAVLTHDVECSKGIENIRRVLDLEQRHGFVSSWNFVAEEYDIPAGLFDEIRAAGCEVGLHGIRHDGRLFSTRARFERDLPKLHGYLSAWQATGFRSPATLRNVDWIPEIGSAYDSSFPDTDPFEPRPGGCCSIFPFFIGEMVELPITLPQDHTLFEILRQRTISRWIEKSAWIIRHHGLVNIIIHPDYMLGEERLDHYEQFLLFLKSQSGCWHALPREVADWWRTRALLTVDSVDTAVGQPLRATVAQGREEAGEIVLEPAHDAAAQRS